jgi:hypothetical protein
LFLALYTAPFPRKTKTEPEPNLFPCSSPFCFFVELPDAIRFPYPLLDFYFFSSGLDKQEGKSHHTVLNCSSSIIGWKTKHHENWFIDFSIPSCPFRNQRASKCDMMMRAAAFSTEFEHRVTVS